MTSDFNITNKVALVTGGASGIGLECSLGLLSDGARGVTLADVNEKAGSEALQQIEKNFGKNKAIFVKCDVSKFSEFENAFNKTIDKFHNIDILINNAGIFNDSIWEKEVAVNVNGVIHGMLLGMDKFIPKYKSGKEGLIVNMSSIAGCEGGPWTPIYCGTKYAIRGLTVSWGKPEHFERSNVRVIGVCPGVTLTPLITELYTKTLGPAYRKLCEADNPLAYIPTQTPGQMAGATMKIIKKAENGTMWVVEGGEQPYQFEGTDRFTTPKKYI